jgi:glycosidase
MNYPVRDALIGFLKGAKKAPEFSTIIDRQLTQYPRQNVYAMYNPLGSHDTPRIITELGMDRKKLLMAYAFLLAYPGAPAIYYGDEIGLSGEKDPDCRKAFPWDQAEWDRELRANIQRLINIRKNSAALRRGDFRALLVDEKRVAYAFARKSGESSLMVILNASATRRQFRISVEELGWNDGRILQDLLSRKEFIVSGSEVNITVEPWEAMWVK